eukprot:6183538-Pleurochrysis_carterae.AAC.1
MQCGDNDRKSAKKNYLNTYRVATCQRALRYRTHDGSYRSRDRSDFSGKSHERGARWTSFSHSESALLACI